MHSEQSQSLQRVQELSRGHAQSAVSPAVSIIATPYVRIMLILIRTMDIHLGIGAGYCSAIMRNSQGDSMTGGTTQGGICGTIINLGTCTTCGGDGLVDRPIKCSHGRSSSHSYCSHNEVGQHD